MATLNVVKSIYASSSEANNLRGNCTPESHVSFCYVSALLLSLQRFQAIQIHHRFEENALIVLEVIKN